VKAKAAPLSDLRMKATEFDRIMRQAFQATPPTGREKAKTHPKKKRGR
jgi:hypothetical protein